MPEEHRDAGAPTPATCGNPLSVTIPERDEFAADAMNEALEMLRTCHLALQLDSKLLDGDAIESITFTLGTAVRMLGHIDEALNKPHRFAALVGGKAVRP